jgi:DNA uptake protein ComE-like DNA-binding protein
MRVGKRWILTALMAVLLAAVCPRAIHGQVGKSLGVVDVNVASDKDLSAMPHMTPAIVKALVAARPFKSIAELNTFLLGQGLTQPQAMEFYGKAFVTINLNTASPEEILLVPGAGKRMVREFAEYRPWKTYAQFDKEIGKYIGGAENAQKLAQYTFIPINANTASDADLLTVPGVDQKLVATIKQNRQYKASADFEKALGSSVSDKDKKRIARYFVFE